MTWTNFPNGITSFGVPVFGTLPAIRGQYFFVDPAGGSNGATGKSIKAAVADIEEAYSLCTDAVGDGIVLISRGNSGSTTTSYLSASIDWTKSSITVVGMCAPTRFSNRSRISTAETNLPYLIDVQGHNNIFVNISLFNSGSDPLAVGCLKVTGQRNYFGGVHAVGGAGKTPADNDRSLELGLGGDENHFEACTFGTDTFDGGNKILAPIYLNGGGYGARNYFHRCMTLSVAASGTAQAAIRIGGAGAGIIRNIIFEKCLFQVFKDGISAAGQLSAVTAAAWPNNGNILMIDCAFWGFAKVNATNNDVVQTSSTASSANGGIVAKGYA